MTVMVAMPWARSDRQPARGTATTANGLRYEARVSRWLAARYNFHSQVGFEGPKGLFIPDGLLFDSAFSRCCVVEVKNQHCQEGIRQLLQYQSWLSSWFGRPVQALLITQVYRPELAMPIVPELECILHCREAVLGVAVVAARSLPRLRGGAGCGLDLDQRAADFAVRSIGGARHSDDRVQRHAGVVAAARAG